MAELDWERRVRSQGGKIVRGWGAYFNEHGQPGVIVNVITCEGPDPRCTRIEIVMTGDEESRALHAADFMTVIDIVGPHDDDLDEKVEKLLASGPTPASPKR